MTDAQWMAARIYAQWLKHSAASDAYGRLFREVGGANGVE